VTRACPECGTINSVRAASCWRCREAFDDSETKDLLTPSSGLSATALASGVILAVPILLVGGGILGTAAAGGGVPEMVLSSLFCTAAAPALLYLFRFAYTHWNSAGGGVIAQVGGAMLGSFTVSFLVAIAAVVMFVITCFPVGLAGPKDHIFPTDDWLMVAVGAGIVGGGVGAFLAVRLIFRRKRPPV
jgi:hypothetical protein